MTTPASFDLTSHGLTVTEVHHNLSPSALYEHAIRFEKDASIAENGALVGLLGRENWTLTEGQARGQESRLGERYLVGDREYPLRRTHLPNQPATRARLPEHTRATLLLRRFRRMGPKVSHQGPRHLLSAISRPFYAHDAHPPDARGACELWRSRFRDLQRRLVSGKSPHNRHGLDDKYRPEPRRQGTRHPRNRICRGDEEGSFHGRELLRTEAGRALDALLGHGGQRDRRVIAALRTQRHG